MTRSWLVVLAFSLLAGRAFGAVPKQICQIYDGPGRSRDKVALIAMPAGLRLDRINGREIAHGVWSDTSCATGPTIIEVVGGHHDASVRNGPSSGSVSLDVEPGASYRLTAKTRTEFSGGRAVAENWAPILEVAEVPATPGQPRSTPCWAIETSGVVSDVDLRSDPGRFTIDNPDGTTNTVYLGRKRRDTFVYGGNGARSAIKPGRRVRAYEDSCTKPGYVYRVDIE